MKKTTLLPFLCATAAGLAIASTSFAGYKGSIQFTDEERRAHEQGLKVIMDTASQCLQADLARHNDFIKRFGISAFFGDNSSFAKKKVSTEGGVLTVETTAEDKRNMLRKLKVKESLVEQLIPDSKCEGGIKECPLMMQPTSCIGLSMKCLGAGFEAAGQGALWDRLSEFTFNNGTQGDALQVGLQQLGWKLVYWNPDMSRAKEWDLDEQEKYPGDPKHIWGQHEETIASVFGRRHNYLYETVDDWKTMVNFGANVPERIKKVPFFVGIAHLGYHVFPGSYGQIIEGHSTRLVNDKETLQTSPFSPLSQGGGPRGGPYKSGLVAVPPGY